MYVDVFDFHEQEVRVSLFICRCLTIERRHSCLGRLHARVRWLFKSTVLPFMSCVPTYVEEPLNLVDCGADIKILIVSSRCN